MSSRLHVLVHSGPDPTHTQLVRVPKSGGKPGKALRALVQAAAKKLRMGKALAKTAALHGSGDGRHKGAVIQSVDMLAKGDLLRLCSAEESAALLAAAVGVAARGSIVPRSMLPDLPEQMWELIANEYCRQQRARAEPWIQERLKALRRSNSSGGDCTEVETFRRLLSHPARPHAEDAKDRQQSRNQRIGGAERGYDELEDEGQEVRSPAEPPAAPEKVPCREAFVLSCVNRRWHRIIGNSPKLDLLGSWFYNVGGEWVPYSSEASWDLEVARILGKSVVTVAVCEPRQDLSGRGRRRHVVVDLARGIQTKSGRKAGKGRVFRVKRLPVDVLSRLSTDPIQGS